MKKNISLAIFAILFLIVNVNAYAATPTSIPTPSVTESDEEKLDKLKEDIVSTVAKKKLVERRGIIGKVDEATNTQITITDSKSNIRFVDVDELTKFSSPTAKGTFGISDITKNSTVGILGLYNKESRRILARFVNVTTAPVIIHGGVSVIDSDNFTLNIATEDGKQITVEVENLTRTYSYTQQAGYLRAGFSKIKENANIIAIGVLDKANESKLIATKIIFFPEIPSNPKINSVLKRVQK